MKNHLLPTSENSENPNRISDLSDVLFGYFLFILYKKGVLFTSPFKKLIPIALAFFITLNLSACESVPQSVPAAEDYVPVYNDSQVSQVDTTPETTISEEFVNANISYINESNIITELQPIETTGNHSQKTSVKIGIDEYSIYETSLTIVYPTQDDIEKIAQLTDLRDLCLYIDDETIDITSLKSLENLEKLDIWGAPKIKGLGSIGKMTKLKHLDLSDVSISDLSFVKNLKYLEYLGIQSSEKSDFVVDCSVLENLTELTDLCIRNYDVINYTEIEKLTKLDQLTIENSSVENLDFLSELINIEILYLGSNPIENIEPLKHLEKLKWLDISNTRIIDFSPIYILENLEQLYLGSLKLSDINFITNMNSAVKLKRIMMSDNEITNIDVLENLENLEWIDISQNKITSIKPIENLHYLYIVSINDNPISDLSPIISAGKNGTNIIGVKVFNININEEDIEIFFNSNSKFVYRNFGE